MAQPVAASSTSGWEIATAIGTLGAVAVALLAIGLERRAAWVDGRDRDAAQARLFIEAGKGIASGDGIHLEFVNHSQQPIIEFAVEDVTWNGTFPVQAAWRVPPTIMGARGFAATIAPGASVKVPVEFVDAEGARQRLQIPGSYSVRYSYMDAAGLRWERTTFGQPRRIREREWARRNASD